MRDPIAHLRREARNNLLGGIVALLFLVPILYLLVVAPLIGQIVGYLGLAGILVAAPTQFHFWRLGPYRHLVTVPYEQADEARDFCLGSVKGRWREFDAVLAQIGTCHAFTFEREQDAALVKLFCT